MNAEDVARYLRDNPDFLSDHGELFTRLTVPHPRHGGQAISLAERQLHALRDKIGQLEQKLSELIRFGEENDDISEKVHRLAVALLGARSLDGVHHAVFVSLQEDFSVPHVALRTWRKVGGEDESVAVGEATRRYVEGLRHPYCGAPDNIEVLGWLGEAAPHVRSIALIPLIGNGATMGALVLGSAEAERFYAEMGTLYLGRIGDLVAAALAS
ncbi:MAG: DUF484 family protein [Betaproteobacteria bacterium]|nr:MAG: DUF484 family protein [Betaproteobacteria bacterium]